MQHNHRFIAAIAGAGTGKTYSLVENYLSSLFGFTKNNEKYRPQEIVALTFTEKAAYEMRLRIIARLNAMLNETQGDPLINKSIELGREISHEEIKRILRAIPNASIGTFHGFSSSLLRKYSYQFSCRDDFDILTQKDEQVYARNILRPIILKNIEQKNSVVRSMLARFRMTGNNFSLGLIESFLEIYFKMPEMALNIEDFLRTEKKPQINFHVEKVEKSLLNFQSLTASSSTTKRLVEILQIWQETKEIFFTDDEHRVAQAFSALRTSLKGNFGDKIARSAAVTSVVDLGVQLVERFVFDDENEIIKILRDFDKEFSWFKGENALVSYADLLLLLRDGLIKNHDLRNTIKKSIKHILVDEYQDTSPLQEDILAILLENKTQESSFSTSHRILDSVDLHNGPSLFMVGDKKQSIYGFRGADASLFDQIINKLKYHDESDFSQRLLTINRRSSMKVINLVNLVSKITLKDQHYSSEQALEAFYADLPGSCALWIKDDAQKDKTKTNLSCAINGIAHLLATRKDCSARDIVVLVRRIKQATKIKEGLNDFGIDAKIIGGEGFFQQQEVVDILAALFLVVDPGCEYATLIVLRSPLVLLRDEEILLVKTTFGSMSLIAAQKAYEQEIFSKESACRFAAFYAAIQSIQKDIFDVGLAVAIDRLILATQYSFSLGLAHHPFQKLANIRKLRMLALRSQENPVVAIQNFMNQIRYDAKEPIGESAQDNNAVTIMTIHQSKGLEFKIVVLADGESQIPHSTNYLLASKSLGLALKPRNRPIAHALPQARDKDLSKTRFDSIAHDRTQREYQEMARLLYVAMTRAQEEFIMVSSKSSFDNPDKNLVGLFLQAYKSSPQEFLEACEIISIGDFQGQAVIHAGIPLDNATQLFEHKSTMRRIFASGIDANSDEESVYADNSSRQYLKPIAGDLAHKLLASAGRLVFLDKKMSEEKAVTASFYALENYVNEYADATRHAVCVTLRALRKIIIDDAQYIFEMPLSCEPKPGIVVEGFADLVIMQDQLISIIEFKSTRKSSRLKKSYCQVLAYAEALFNHFTLPVQFSVYLIGSHEEPCFHLYDDKARHELLASLKNL